MMRAKDGFFMDFRATSFGWGSSLAWLEAAFDVTRE